MTTVLSLTDSAAPTTTVAATTTAAITATGTSLPVALTTPFVQPGSCSDIFSTTNFFVGASGFAEEYITVAVSDATDPQFTACMPSGWGDLAATRRFEFSPAVCPSGWTAYNLRSTALTTALSGTTSYAGLTTAYCCASNDHLGWFDSVKGLHNASLASMQSPACIQTLGPATATTDDEGWTTTTRTTTAPITSVLVQNAWHISWQTTDVQHLTPSPPPWPCSDNYGYPTWVPTVSITPEPNCKDGHYVDHSFDALARFLYIGLPIICAAVLLSCCACFYRAGRLGGAPRRRRMQARAERAARAEQAREDQQALQVARTADATDAGDSIPLKAKP
ncbi:hypothetical protein HMPREF1624_08253 [Sporothrix schenckii ATCC 58251]|uniref:Uncharacterized protein n=1 Tax=Sporothrix schenckii (strain ATCC 58251 / de Perez 2211183) TaxID=1391915 RepID=U7PLL1_SPOS1|nr:hypothetical protein HMPREF1624_08253 [Sporothrix schenckii ATCC 58251]